MSISDAAVEATAKAIHQVDFGAGIEEGWDRLTPEGQEDYFEYARAALSVLSLHDDRAALRAMLQTFVNHDTDDTGFIHNGQVACWIPKATFANARALIAEKDRSDV